MATIRRLLKIIGLFCKRALLKRRYSAKETYDFEEPTTRSHPLVLVERVHVNTDVIERIYFKIHIATLKQAKKRRRKSQVAVLVERMHINTDHSERIHMKTDRIEAIHIKTELVEGIHINTDLIDGMHGTTGLIERIHINAYTVTLIQARKRSRNRRA